MAIENSGSPHPPTPRALRSGGRRIGDASPGRDPGAWAEAALRAAEAEALQAGRIAQLEAANQELREVAAAVAHELRASVRRQERFLGLLAFRAVSRLDPEGHRLLARARAASQWTATCLDSALWFDQQDNLPLTLRPVDLNRLVAEVVDDFRLELKERRVTWVLDELPIIHGDPGLLRSVFQNLLGNALKFSGCRADTRIQVGCAGDPAAGPVVFVRDNGKGFDPAQGARLFRPFQRLHRRDERPGPGIGLATVKRIIGRHGGRVWAEGSPDQGATFFISFPAARSAT